MCKFETNNITPDNNHLLKNNDSDENAIFDQQLFLSRALNDKILAIEVIELFLKALPENLNNIKIAIDQNDGILLQRSAHKIKGSLANISANNAKETAYKLERFGKESNFTLAQDSFKDFKKEIEILVIKLKDFME